MKVSKNDTLSEQLASRIGDRPPASGQIERMLTIEEAARQLGYTPSGLYKIVDTTRKGKPGAQIQFFQVGKGPIKFKQQWLDEFVLSNSVEPGQVQPLRKPTRGRKTIPTNYVQIEPHWALAV